MMEQEKELRTLELQGLENKTSPEAHLGYHIMTIKVKEEEEEEEKLWVPNNQDSKESETFPDANSGLLDIKIKVKDEEGLWAKDHQVSEEDKTSSTDHSGFSDLKPKLSPKTERGEEALMLEQEFMEENESPDHISGFPDVTVKMEEDKPSVPPAFEESEINKAVETSCSGYSDLKPESSPKTEQGKEALIPEQNTVEENEAPDHNSGLPDATVRMEGGEPAVPSAQEASGMSQAVGAPYTGVLMSAQPISYVLLTFTIPANNQGTVQRVIKPQKKRRASKAKGQRHTSSLLPAPQESVKINSVEALQQTPFFKLPLADKLQIKKMGPERPPLMLHQSGCDRGKEYTRTFSTSWYDRKKWLCGSATKDALFCFPCLLFGSDKSWTQTGVQDLKHLTDKTRKHEESKSHMENCVQLTMLGTEAAAQMDEGDHVRQHNQEVENNKYILSKIIDCIRFCGAFELALSGHGETEDSENPGVFKGLVNLVASIDSAMELHLQSATVLRGLPKTVQNELLDCMLTVAKDHIKEQLKSSHFVAIQADYITHLMTDCQTALIFRYVDEDCSPVERFYGFTRVEDSRPETIATVLLQQLEDVFPEATDKQKLIAQSYDGVSVIHGGHTGVQKRIQDVFPNAHYVHSYAHQLHLVMPEAVYQIREVRIFFAQLFAFPEFFAHRSERKAVLEAVVRRRFPKSSQMGWNLNIQRVNVVNVVFEKRLELIECFHEIRDGRFDLSAVHEAYLLLRLLEDDGEFLYLLSLFRRIMPHVETFDKQLQRPDSDPVAVRKATLDFVRAINSVRDSIPSLFSELPPESLLPRDKTKGILDHLASQVCTIIIAHAKERFAFTSHLAGATLVQGHLFPAHNQKFPQEALKKTVEAYPMLRKDRLKTELTILYKSQEFYSCENASTLLHMLLENNLETILEQTVTLLRILITTPTMTGKSEQMSSALKRINTFLRNIMSEDWLSALAMLSIEKEMIKQIPDFNHKTIELFARQTESQASFLCKQ